MDGSPRHHALRILVSDHQTLGAKLEPRAAGSDHLGRVGAACGLGPSCKEHDWGPRELILQPHNRSSVHSEVQDAAL